MNGEWRKGNWEIRFNELVKYNAKHGDCNVPQRQGQLGSWVYTQGTNYKKGKLPHDRLNRLNGIGFDWTPPRGRKAPPSTRKHSLSRQERVSSTSTNVNNLTVGDGARVPWETRFKELVQYKAKHGDCNVPQRQGQLGWWAVTQRQSYRKGELSQDRINHLNGIGFDWTPPMGSRKRKAPPSTRKQTSRKVRLSSPSTKVNSPSAGDGARCAEPNGFKGEGRGATSAKVPSRRSDRNRGTESDDEVDEIGALIYDQVMRRR